MGRKKILQLFAGLFIFHILISALFYFISVKGYFPSFHNHKGIWNYAIDSSGYHQEALKGLELLKERRWGQWWRHKYGSNWWHVRWIALMYWCVKPIPLAMAPLNAFLWASGFILMFFIAKNFLSTQKALITAGMFSLFPSHIMNSIQLLKDPFYILGTLLFINGWVWAWRKRGLSLAGLIFAALNTAIGCYLVFKIRSYLLPAWILTGVVFYLLSIITNKKRIIPATILLTATLTVSAVTKHISVQYKFKIVLGKAPAKQRRIATSSIVGYPWKYSNWIPDKIEHILIKLSKARYRYCTLSHQAGSNIDNSVYFHSARDVVKYIPRALEIGMLAPFPPFWLKKAKTCGRICSIVTGGEMLILYFLYIGVVLWFCKRRRIEETGLILWGIFFILLLSLVVINLGTLYRMRHIYLLSFFIFGIGGWGEALKRIKNN